MVMAGFAERAHKFFLYIMKMPGIIKLYKNFW